MSDFTPYGEYKAVSFVDAVESACSHIYNYKQAVQRKDKVCEFYHLCNIAMLKAAIIQITDNKCYVGYCSLEKYLDYGGQIAWFVERYLNRKSMKFNIEDYYASAMSQYHEEVKKFALG